MDKIIELNKLLALKDALYGTIDCYQNWEKFKRDKEVLEIDLEVSEKLFPDNEETVKRRELVKELTDNIAEMKQDGAMYYQIFRELCCENE